MEALSVNLRKSHNSPKSEVIDGHLLHPVCDENLKEDDRR